MPKEHGKDVKEGETWVAVRIPADAKERLATWAKRYDHSLSWILRRLALRALDNDEDQNGGIP